MKRIHLIAAAALLIGAGCAASPAPSPANTPVPSQAPVPVTEADSVIDLSAKGLKTVPADVFSHVNVLELNLAGNDLTGALPSEIGRLKKLKILDASNNDLTGIPAEIGQLTDLEAIDFSNNKITGLPLELGNLKNLKVLNLTGNSPAKQDLDAIKAKLPNLTVITK